MIFTKNRSKSIANAVNKKVFFIEPYRRLPLRFILIVPFALQIFGAVGLVWYFSFKHSQNSIQDLAEQLMLEIEGRIDEHLNSYLANPHQINQLNQNALDLGHLDSQSVATFLGIFTANKIARPILRLSNDSSAIAQGDLSQQV